MFCEKCGSQIPDDSTFCEKCGARTSDEKASQAPLPAYPDSNASEYPTNQQPYAINRRSDIKSAKTISGMKIGFIIAGVVIIALIGFYAVRSWRDANYVYVPGTLTSQKPPNPPPLSDKRPSGVPDIRQGSGGGFPAEISGNPWYLYYELNTDKYASQPMYWYYYSAEFIPDPYTTLSIYDIALTPLSGGEITDNPHYPGSGHMPVFTIEASARYFPENGEMLFTYWVSPITTMSFEQWEYIDGAWYGAAWEVGDDLTGEYSKRVILSNAPMN